MHIRRVSLFIYGGVLRCCVRLSLLLLLREPRFCELWRQLGLFFAKYELFVHEALVGLVNVGAPSI